MPGINTTGAPDTRDYVVGRGIVRFAELNSVTGLPDADGFRDLGNATAFTITSETEDLRHKNSRDCVSFTDARFVLNQEVGLSFTLDETRNFENLAMFFAGSVEVYDNPHDVTHTDVSVTTAVKLGNWYELRKANGDRVYNLDAAGTVYTLEMDDTVDVLLVEGTDYEIDEQLGLVRFLPTAVNVADGDPVVWNISTGATTPQDIDQMNALQSQSVEGCLLFVQDNAGDCGQKIELRFHKVSLSPEGDLGLISDEVAEVTLSGVAEVNNLVSDTSKVLTVRTYNMV